MPTDQTIDFVVMFLIIGLLALGLGSVLLGWLVRTWDRVRHYQPVMSSVTAQTDRQTETDDQTDLVSEADMWLDRIELDRTRTAVIELLVYSGWTTSQVRAILKGDTGTIGTEVEAARGRLGITAEPRMLKVRDERGERAIPMEVAP